VNHQNENEDTALMLAASKGHINLMMCLVEYGNADVFSYLNFSVMYLIYLTTLFDSYIFGIKMGKRL
jgi:ankyrin repeat protein